MNDSLTFPGTTSETGSQLGAVEQGVSIRRRIGAVLFGVVYGGTLVDGVGSGVGYVLGDTNYDVGQTPYLREPLYLLSIMMMGTLAGHVGGSVSLGAIAAAIGTALLLAPDFMFSGAVPSFATRLTLGAIAFAAAGGAALVSSRIQAESQDLQFGRVFGINWKHWLWLFLPWRYIIANVVWLGTPRFLLLHTGVGLGSLADILKSVAGVLVVSYGGFRALRTLRADNGLTRKQAVVQFFGWFVVAPVLADLWRLLF